MESDIDMLSDSIMSLDSQLQQCVVRMRELKKDLDDSEVVVCRSKERLQQKTHLLSTKDTLIETGSSLLLKAQKFAKTLIQLIIAATQNDGIFQATTISKIAMLETAFASLQSSISTWKSSLNESEFDPNSIIPEKPHLPQLPQPHNVRIPTPVVNLHPPSSSTQQRQISPALTPPVANNNTANVQMMMSQQISPPLPTPNYLPSPSLSVSGNMPNTQNMQNHHHHHHQQQQQQILLQQQYKQPVSQQNQPSPLLMKMQGDGPLRQQALNSFQPFVQPSHAAPLPSKPVSHSPWMSNVAAGRGGGGGGGNNSNFGANIAPPVSSLKPTGSYNNEKPPIEQPKDIYHPQVFSESPMMMMDNGGGGMMMNMSGNNMMFPPTSMYGSGGVVPELNMPIMMDNATMNAQLNNLLSTPLNMPLHLNTFHTTTGSGDLGVAFNQPSMPFNQHGDINSRNTVQNIGLKQTDVYINNNHNFPTGINNSNNVIMTDYNQQPISQKNNSHNSSTINGAEEEDNYRYFGFDE